MAKHSVFCIETFLMILLVALVAMNTYQIIQNNTLKMLIVGPEPTNQPPSPIPQQLSPLVMGNPLNTPAPHQNMPLPSHGGMPPPSHGGMPPPSHMDPMHGGGMQPQHIEPYMGPPGPPMGPPMGMPMGMPQMGGGPHPVSAREGFNAMF
jgi:hypothetical protein